MNVQGKSHRVSYVVRLISLLVLLVLVVPVFGPVQADDPEPLTVRSVGVLDADGTVLYSVIVASAPDKEFGNLTITSTVPEGALFIEKFWTPETATFAGEFNGTVTWTLPALPANTIIGPFTYRAAFKENADKPLNVAARVVAGDVTADAAPLDHLSFSEATTLVPLAESASITIDQNGTGAPVPVGETGIWLDVPAGAVSQETTLTFTRIPLENSGLPQELYWWCTLVQIDANPAVKFALPVSLALPTRRTLTPGMEAFMFMPDTPGQWVDAAEKGISPNFGNVFLGPDGTYIGLADTPLLAGLAQGSVTVAAGVGNAKRTAGTTTITTASGDVRNLFVSSDGSLRGVDVEPSD